MKVTGFLIMEPGGDRPYFSHTMPAEYQRKPGSKIFLFCLDVPGFEKVDGVIQASASEVVDAPDFTRDVGAIRTSSPDDETPSRLQCYVWICPKCRVRYQGALPSLTTVERLHEPYCGKMF